MNTNRRRVYEIVESKSYVRHVRYVDEKSKRTGYVASTSESESVASTSASEPSASSSTESVSSRRYCEYSDHYPMNRNPKGYAVIINIMNPENDKPREGSDIDADNLEDYFQSMNFIVNKMEDLPGSGIYSEIRKISELDHSPYDAFVCCILSHGSNRNVIGIDGTPIRISKLMDLVIGCHCPTLAGKPKLFFIQACQGQDDHQVVEQTDDCADLIAKVPSGSDMLLAIATTSGHVSYRHPKKGSRFIQSLVKHLSESYVNRPHLLEVLTMVNKDVGRTGQQPAVGHTLHKKVYL